MDQNADPKAEIGISLLLFGFSVRRGLWTERSTSVPVLRDIVAGNDIHIMQILEALPLIIQFLDLFYVPNVPTFLRVSGMGSQANYYKYTGSKPARPSGTHTVYQVR